MLSDCHSHKPGNCTMPKYIEYLKGTHSPFHLPLALIPVPCSKYNKPNLQLRIKLHIRLRLCRSMARQVVLWWEGRDGGVVVVVMVVVGTGGVEIWGHSVVVEGSRWRWRDGEVRVVGGYTLFWRAAAFCLHLIPYKVLTTYKSLKVMVAQKFRLLV